MRKLRRSGMPGSQADATVEIAADVTRGPLTQEQLEATLNRALLRQAAVIITIIITVMTAIMAVMMTALLAAFT